MPFVRFVKETGHKVKIIEVMDHLREKRLIQNEALLSPWGGSDSHNDKWLASNINYSVKGIDLENWFPQHVGPYRKAFSE